MKFKLIGVIIISMLFFTGCTEKKEKLAIVSSNKVTVDNNIVFFVNIEQTKYKKPLTPDDDGFDMYKSRFYGQFALVSRNVSGEEIDRIALNQFFENRDMGFIGEFKLGFQDMNADGDLDIGYEFEK
ncbi:MAG: hypothetical protein HPY74_19815 [Firmicutes bacterium]|nr:hypothetical protein [Bacillota bacterium]